MSPDTGSALIKKIFCCLVCCSLAIGAARGQQGKIIDEVVAVVADNIVLHSELQMEFEQLRKEAPGINDSAICEILRQKMIERLLLSKAQFDSVEVNEERVDNELEKRIRYFASQHPDGEKGLEEFYGKTISQIKADNREKIRNNMLMQEMQGKILKDVKVSPTDIKKFYNEMAATDSLPYYSAEVEIAQLVIEPKVTQESKEIAYHKVSELRDRILQGDNFRTLAVIYSDDKGSAAKGGELGYFTRGDMVPEFEATAFRLRPDSVSKIVETKFGYHILQLIDRKGDNINVRHILIRPQLFRSDLDRAREVLDSIVWLIKIDSISFENAAKKFSDDIPTRAGGGFITEGQIGTTHVPIDELDKNLYFTVEKMKAGDISEPETIVLPGPDRQQAWRVLFLRSESKPHRCNLRDDYQKLQAMAFDKKQKKALHDWMLKYKKQVYMHVSDSYLGCAGIQEFLKK